MLLVRPAMDVDPPSSHCFIVVVFFTVKLLINGKVQQTYSPTPSILAPFFVCIFYSKGFKNMGKSPKNNPLGIDRKNTMFNRSIIMFII